MEDNQENLDTSDNMSRRERKKLARAEREKENKEYPNNSKWIWVLLIIFLIGGIYMLVKKYTSPLPGEEAADLGREHVTDIAGIEYSSNPPTSGPHFAIWAKQGVYNRLISDGHLIHSLEHGYIVIWYDCTKEIKVSNLPSFIKSKLIPNVYAHDEPVKESTDSGQLLKHLKFQPKQGESWFTPENPPEEEVKLSEVFSSEMCKSFVSRLSESTKIAERVIIAPRTNMESLIALTAWGRIQKLDSLDQSKIRTFIKAHHNRGPEKTME